MWKKCVKSPHFMLFNSILPTNSYGQLMKGIKSITVILTIILIHIIHMLGALIGVTFVCATQSYLWDFLEWNFNPLYHPSGLISSYTQQLIDFVTLLKSIQICAQLGNYKQIITIRSKFVRVFKEFVFSFSRFTNTHNIFVCVYEREY